MRYKFLQIIALVFCLISCKERKTNSKLDLVVDIDAIAYDYVIKKRDWYRFSAIYLYGSIINQGQGPKEIFLEELDDYCDFEKKGFFDIILGDSLKINLINTKKDIKKILKSNDTINFKLRIQQQHLDTNDNIYFQLDHLIRNRNNLGCFYRESNCITIQLKESFQSIYKLDDRLYTDINTFRTRYRQNRTILPRSLPKMDKFPAE